MASRKPKISKGCLSSIFCKDGKQLKFWMADCTVRDEIKELIEAHGGVMMSTVTRHDTETIRLEKNDCKKTKFENQHYYVDVIYNSIKKKVLQEFGKYACGAEIKSRARGTERRKRAENYTPQEDDIIVRYLIEHAGDKLRDTVKGKDGVVRPKHSLRADFHYIQEEKLPHRTVESIRERYRTLRRRVMSELDKPTAVPSLGTDEIESMSDEDDEMDVVEDVLVAGVVGSAGKGAGRAVSSSPAVARPGRRTRHVAHKSPRDDGTAAVATEASVNNEEEDDNEEDDDNESADDNELDSQIASVAVRVTHASGAPPQQDGTASSAAASAGAGRTTRRTAATSNKRNTPAQDTPNASAPVDESSELPAVASRASKRLKQSSQPAHAMTRSSSARGGHAPTAAPDRAEAAEATTGPEEKNADGSTARSRGESAVGDESTATSAADTETAAHFDSNPNWLRRAIAWMVHTTGATPVEVFRTLYQHSGSVDKTLHTLQDTAGEAPRGCAPAHDALLSQGPAAIQQHVKLYSAALSAERIAFLNHEPSPRDDDD